MAKVSGPVPSRYFGVWARTRLTTPELNDNSTFVRWMQLSVWHADLRVPVSESQSCQGFSGLTRVSERHDGEVCTWHRLVDYQAPRDTVDEGYMVFETPERVIETGIHGVYHEVWERLAGSEGQRLALAEPLKANGSGGTRLFVSGEYVMRVRPCTPLGPAFEITFGRWSGQSWHIEQSTIKQLVNQILPLHITRSSIDTAAVQHHHEDASEWGILEWATPT